MVFSKVFIFCFQTKFWNLTNISYFFPNCYSSNFWRTNGKTLYNKRTAKTLHTIENSALHTIENSATLETFYLSLFIEAWKYLLIFSVLHKI